jgi:phage tail sheath protein FI
MPLIVAPGYPEVVDELVALSNTVNDEAFVIADVPVTKTPEQAATWAMSSERVSSPNVAYYYPWGLASNLDGRAVTIAPSGIALRTYAYSDENSYLWLAPAGVTRGSVTGVGSVGYVSGTLGTPTTFIETNLNQGQRDNLYEFFKNINPIVFFPGRGLIVWGQKTSYGAASALDRVNVMRLLMYIKREMRKGAFPFLFEPNDKLTRDNLKAAADGFLSDILAKRGLYDFVTLCDESNNTPDRIDRNELYLDIALKPMKSVEFIYVPIRVLSTGAQMP